MSPSDILQTNPNMLLVRFNDFIKCAVKGSASVNDLYTIPWRGKNNPTFVMGHYALKAPVSSVFFSC